MLLLKTLSYFDSKRCIFNGTFPNVQSALEFSLFFLGVEYFKRLKMNCLVFFKTKKN